MDNNKIQFYNIIKDKNRRRILKFCRKSRSFTELKKLMKISTGALVYHLSILQKARVVKKEQIKTKGKFERGKKVRITINNDELIKKQKVFVKVWFSDWNL